MDIELPAPAKIPEGNPNYNPALESLTLADLKDFCIELEKETFARSADIKNIPYLGADLNRDFSIVANHKGLFYTEKDNSVSVGAGAVAVRGGISKLGNFVKSGRDWSEFTVGEIADLVGFSNSSHFSSCFKARYGCSPSEYVRKQDKTNINNQS